MDFEDLKINFMLKNRKAIKFVYYSIFTIAFVFISYLVVLTLIFQKSIIINNNSSDYDICQKLNILNKDTQQNNNSLIEQLADQGKLKKFNNYDELKKFLNNNSNSFNYDRVNILKDIAPIDALNVNKINFAERSQNIIDTNEVKNKVVDFSLTNNQVKGVDEADIIKTDGKYIYALSNNSLFIIDAYPASGAQIISKIEFKSNPQNIFIKDDRLIVYGNDNLIYNKPFYNNFRRGENFSFLKIFDIADKINPKQIKDLDFEGNVIGARMINNYIYFITSTNIDYYNSELSIPKIIENDVIINNQKKTDVFYTNIPSSRYVFTNVSVINIENSDDLIKNSVYLLGFGQNLYVSQNNIYIIYTKYISKKQIEMKIFRDFLLPKLSLKNQNIIKEIDIIPNYILSQNEKAIKVNRILSNYFYSLSQEEQSKLEEIIKQKLEEIIKQISDELEKTVIHKIAIEGNKLEYKASGEVSGRVLNQFSLDEHNGYFRIATTKSKIWSQFGEGNIDSYNNLYVLDNDLKIVGSVDHLAEGEKIYSVRFMQDRAYLVTFQQVDPLFVIDLKNPQKPQVLGKLKMPGFSNYLHPYNNDILIGVGKDTYTNKNGGVQTKGLKLSLFNVANINNPKEIDSYIIGDSGSSSYVLQDHRAFLFSKDKNLLVIPATLSKSKQGVYFRGALVFNVNNKGFKLKGKISHSKFNSSDKMLNKYYYNYKRAVKRELYINDILYTFSNKYLKMNNLNNLKEIKNLELKKEKVDDF